MNCRMHRLRDGRDQRLMLRAIDHALGNYVEAREIYRRWLQVRANRQLRPGEIPDRREFQRLDQRFNDQYRFEIQNAGYRRVDRSRIHWKTEDCVIALARSFPVMGLRQTATRVHMTVRRIIREEGLRPYRLQQVQAPQPRDHRVRRNFCHWMLCKLINNSRFLENVLFSDEAAFSTMSILNRQNIRIWAHRNPHAIQQRIIQGRFVVNVWAGIVENNFIGPVYLPMRLNSQHYLTFLRHDFLHRLNNTPSSSKPHLFYA